jgi:hypothetical protein
MRTGVILAALAILVGSAAPAMAQRYPFERSFDVADGVTLDAQTTRGKIEVKVGQPGRILVSGIATVRIGWSVPADAARLAEQFAANPEIAQQGNAIRLKSPSDPAQERAIAVSYVVTVPPATVVTTVSDSGATVIQGVAGRVSVRTASATIELTDLLGDADVTTGSGAVTANGVAGSLSISTGSSAFNGRGLGGDLRVRTSSGAVNATLDGAGTIDVQTSSSAIDIRGVRGPLKTVTQSGRTSVRGQPDYPWSITSGSGSVNATLETAKGFRLDAATGSGSVTVEGADVRGSVSKRRVAGTVRGEGPLVRINARSGSVSLTVAGK